MVCDLPRNGRAARRLPPLVACACLAARIAVAYPEVESLPGPVVHPHSFEILSNSRISTHSGFTQDLGIQVLANALWAMARVPRLGSYRELYVATPQNVYRYEPEANLLVLHKPGDERYRSNSAFEVGIASDRHEDVGLAAQAGLLAGIAFYDTAGPGVAVCPMRWAADHANANWNPDNPVELVNVYGRAETRGHTDSLAARSSDSTLPHPHTNAPDSFEMVLLELGQDSVFVSVGISLETVSQLLWAAYGPTPHLVSGGKQGLTVPSAIAGYFLTGRIYFVDESGVSRYHCRAPGGSATTADHRLEETAVGDRRQLLRQSAERIPSTAPAYFVLCVSDTVSYRHMQEAGLAAFQLLAQARAVGISGFITAPLSTSERSGIASALNLPADNHPVLVFAVGEPSSGIAEEERPRVVEVIQGGPVIRDGEPVRVDYLLRQSGVVRADVFDMLGRPICRLLEERRSAGIHAIEWDGTLGTGQPVRRGSYVIGIFSSGSVAQHKVTIF